RRRWRRCRRERRCSRSGSRCCRRERRRSRSRSCSCSCSCGRVSCGCGCGCGRCRCWRWRSRTARSAIHAHGEVGGLALIGGGRKVSPKEVAIEERVLVVATWRAHAVGTAGGRVKRTATEVADRRDIEPVDAWRQTNVQSNNLDRKSVV